MFAVCVSIEDYIIELIRQLQEINQNYHQILCTRSLLRSHAMVFFCYKRTWNFALMQCNWLKKSNRKVYLKVQTLEYKGDAICKNPLEVAKCKIEFFCFHL